MTPTSKPSIVALIPARRGSKRIPGKNFKELAGQPLLNYTIDAAGESGIFRSVYVVMDWDDIDPSPAFKAWNDGLPWETKRFAVPRFKRSAESATDDAPDIMWVSEVLETLNTDAFAILRPTSPFRTAETIKRAWAEFQAWDVDSLRAVQRVKEHPQKMWYTDVAGLLHPLLESVVYYGDVPVPAHSCPTQSLGTYYVQNASLEMAWTRVVTDTGTISGTRIKPFFTEGLEGFDINTPEDWTEAEYHMAERHHPIEYLG